MIDEIDDSYETNEHECCSREIEPVWVQALEEDRNGLGETGVAFDSGIDLTKRQRSEVEV